MNIKFWRGNLLENIHTEYSEGKGKITLRRSEVVMVEGGYNWLGLVINGDLCG
jgi:hypothetical protein